MAVFFIKKGEYLICFCGYALLNLGVVVKSNRETEYRLVWRAKN